MVSGFYLVGALFFHWLMTVDFKRIDIRGSRPASRALFPKNEFEQKILARTSLLQYLTFQFFAVSVLLALPVKLILAVGVDHQVCVGNSLVQYMRSVEERS